MNKIHPTAIVDEKASIHESVEIGPFCIIGPDVSIGEGCKLLSHVVMEGVVSIGVENIFYPFATVGTPPQDLKYNPEDRTEVIIGNQNVFREGFSIHTGTIKQDRKTIVGNSNLFMANSHVGHDAIVGNNCVLVNGALLAGHVLIEDHAVISGGVGITQYTRIGRGSFVAGLCAVDKDILPYSTVHGHRGYHKGVNIIGMKRLGKKKEDIKVLRDVHAYMIKHELSFRKFINSEIFSEYKDNEIIKELVAFAEKSKQGIASIGL